MPEATLIVVTDPGRGVAAPPTPSSADYARASRRLTRDSDGCRPGVESETTGAAREWPRVRGGLGRAMRVIYCPESDRTRTRAAGVTEVAAGRSGKSAETFACEV